MDLLDAAKVAEATIDTSQPSTTELTEAITRLQRSVVTPWWTPQPSSTARRPRSPSPYPRQQPSRRQVNNGEVRSLPRQVSFANRSLNQRYDSHRSRWTTDHNRWDEVVPFVVVIITVVLARHMVNNVVTVANWIISRSDVGRDARWCQTIANTPVLQTVFKTEHKRGKWANCVELLISKRRSRASIDTGASISCLDYDFVKQIQLPITPCTKSKPFYVGADGKRLSVAGHVNTDISIGGYVCTVNFTVMYNL